MLSNVTKSKFQLNSRAITIFCDERGKNQSVKVLPRKRDSSMIELAST